MSAVPSAAKDLGAAVMEVRFAIEYGELHERFWSHIDTGISLAQIVAGGLAFAGIFAPGSNLTAVTGITLAVLAAFQIGLKPRERSIAFRDARRRFSALNAKAWSVGLEEVERELEAVRAEAPRGFDAFTRPAENRVLRTNGYPDRIEPLKPRERLFEALA